MESGERLHRTNIYIYMYTSRHITCIDICPLHDPFSNRALQRSAPNACYQKLWRGPPGGSRTIGASGCLGLRVQVFAQFRVNGFGHEGLGFTYLWL